MSNTAEKGNDPQRWNKLLEGLDEKLQLGLLDKLNKIKAYHFEEDILFLEAGSQEDHDYLKKDSVLQQLELLAQDIIRTEKVKIRNS